MAEGVSFTDGEQISAMASTSLSSGQMSAGGPLDTPTDDNGRTAGVNPSNEEGMPPQGGSMDSPMEA